MPDTNSQTPTLLDRTKRGVVFAAALTWGGCQLWISPPRAPKELRLKKVDQDPTKITITLEYPHTDEGVVSMKTARITILRGANGIDWTCTDRWLFDMEHKSSGEIGVAIMSLPITLPLSPVLLLANYWYTRREQREGISRHGLALLDRIGTALDQQTYDSLVAVLQLEWEKRQRLRAKVSYQQAIDLLSSCHLVWYEDTFFIQAHWYDQTGSGVASYDTRVDAAILVLGSRFTGVQRENLMTLCATAERTDRRGKSDFDDDSED